MGYTFNVMDYYSDTKVSHIMNEEDSTRALASVISKMHQNNTKRGVACTQLPVKHLELPALLIGQIKTLIWRIHMNTQVFPALRYLVIWIERDRKVSPVLWYIAIRPKELFMDPKLSWKSQRRALAPIKGPPGSIVNRSTTPHKPPFLQPIGSTWA